MSESGLLGRLKGQLSAASIEFQVVGLFHPRSTQLLADVAALMAGAAAIGAMTVEAGPAFDMALHPFETHLNDPDLPHRVAVVVTDASVVLYAADRQGNLGPQVCTLGRQTFRAHRTRYIGDIDLTINSPEAGYMVLQAKSGPLHHAALLAADAAVALAEPGWP